MVRFKHRYLVATIAASPEKVAELGPKEISGVLKASISRCWLLVCGCLERNVLVSRREGTCMVLLVAAPVGCRSSSPLGAVRIRLHFEESKATQNYLGLAIAAC